MADEFMRELSQLTGLHHYPKQGPFEGKEGALIGNRDGYLVAIGRGFRAPGDWEHVVIALLIRFPQMGQSETLKGVLKQNATLASLGALGDVGPDFVRWNRKETLRKPKAEQVAKLLETLLDVTKQFAPPFDGRCELCHSSATREITLLNISPGYYCQSCQEKMRLELDAAAVAYEHLPTNFPRGAAFGVAAALVGAVAWGGVAYLAHRIFLYGAILIGYFISWALVKGMGKVTRAGQILVGVLTVASVLLGDAIFYTLSTMEELKAPFSLDLFRAVVAHFWQLESQGSGVFSIFFALGGAGLALLRTRKPKFQARFERLGPSVS